MKDEKGFCPICNANLTGNYSDFPCFYDDQVHFEWRCKNCDTSGSEVYKMDFIGHYDMNNEEIETAFDIDNICDIKEDELNTFIEAKKYKL